MCEDCELLHKMLTDILKKIKSTEIHENDNYRIIVSASAVNDLLEELEKFFVKELN